MSRLELNVIAMDDRKACLILDDERGRYDRGCELHEMDAFPVPVRLAF